MIFWLFLAATCSNTGRRCLCSTFNSSAEPTRKGMPSVPSTGSSPTCWMLSTSAIGTSPSRTARRCSGPLKPSWPPALTVISTLPLVAFLTSSAKRIAFLVWKLPSGQTVERSHLVCAAAEALANARAAAAMRPTAVLRCLLICVPPRATQAIVNLAHAGPLRKPNACAGCTNVVRPCPKEARHAILGYSRLLEQGERVRGGAPRVPRGLALRPAARRQDHR